MSEPNGQGRLLEPKHGTSALPARAVFSRLLCRVSARGVFVALDQAVGMIRTAEEVLALIACKEQYLSE